jgi:hypothetical protein
MIAKLRAGDTLDMSTGSCGSGVCNKRWARVLGVYRINDNGSKADTTAFRGWVYDRYIQSYVCEEYKDPVPVKPRQDGLVPIPGTRSKQIEAHLLTSGLRLPLNVDGK